MKIEQAEAVEPEVVDSDDVARLKEILEEIKELVYEAEGLLPRGARQTARAFWMAHILSALDREHEYLGSSMETMQDTIDELAESRDDEDDE